MNQTLILQSVTQIFGRIVYFYKLQWPLYFLPYRLKDATSICLISNNHFSLQNLIANGEAESEFYQLPDFQELFAEKLHFSLKKTPTFFPLSYAFIWNSKNKGVVL